MKVDIEKMKKKLGRVYIPDERDSNFPLRALLPSRAPLKTYKYWWSDGWWGDQGLTSQCVAYAWVHWLEDGGITQQGTPPPAINPAYLYNEAQKNDVWTGENYEGTSVRAGAKVAQRMGFISEYRWTWNLQELITAILTIGPVVVGTNWYEDMFFPDEAGFIKIGGFNVGGHAYSLCGVNTKTRLFRIKNSWGRLWGNKGYAYISFEDMERLLNENGECCIALEIKKS